MPLCRKVLIVKVHLRWKSETLDSPPGPNITDTLIPLLTSHEDFSLYLAAKLIFIALAFLGLRQSKQV